MNYHSRRNIGYVVWFSILLVMSYVGLSLAIRYGYEERVVELAALAFAYSGVSLVANASKIFD
ncbi:hypothetical protein IQ268_28295 [Oculatella sp. LEGE 06141]|uniref:hypothetical protein n=1 Tax=Oculatella sp. LEGE 06141 TaxID=1828648 RepID=UPI00187F340B|nr:hypothetical protein [Oculatella sp. LEGE 06141]MBE9182454.1 hypothetical protein [Oculatella sp. LEGE 06141]